MEAWIPEGRTAQSLSFVERLRLASFGWAELGMPRKSSPNSPTFQVSWGWAR